MIHVSFSDLRKRLAHYMDRTVDDRAPLLVTRQGHQPVVMMAQADYDSIMETLHLRRSPANAQRLSESMAEFDAGPGPVAADLP